MKYIRTAPGNHGFRRNGRLITVQQGQKIEATKEELGSQVKGYEVYKGQFGKTLLEQETNRYVFIYKPKSDWLNPGASRAHTVPSFCPRPLKS